MDLQESYFHETVSRYAESTYRAYRRYCGILFMISLFALISVSCSDEVESEAPSLKFIADSGYLSTDTTVSAGSRLRLGIEATAGGAGITFLQVRCDDGTSRIILDSGMNCSHFRYTIPVIKSSGQTETWSFIVMDKERNKDTVSLKLYRSAVSNFGAIKTFSSVTLGAQENPAGSFFSFSDGSVMGLAGAFANQANTDLIYYYGPYEATLSSPNESEAPGFFTGENGIAYWSIKNETRYDTTLITPAQFDQSANDSLILAAYEPGAAKRKGKYILPGMVFSLTTAGGRLGLIKIEVVEPGPSGRMSFSLKIQDQ